MVTVRKKHLLLLAALAGCGHSHEQGPAPASSQARRSAPNVGCIGRIVPRDGTFFIGPTVSAGVVPVVTDIRIHQGDEVSAGQVVATLSSRALLEGAVQEAEARLQLSLARLARVKASAAPADAAIARSEISRLELQRQRAASDVERNRTLVEKDYLPRVRLEAFEATVHDTEVLIQQAQERLKGLNSVRPEDVAIAEQEVLVTEAALARARQEAANATVRANAAGHVLRVLGHPGEPVSPQGIAELADTTRMVIMAEVYEGDIARVHIGQRATITSNLLPAPVKGEVVWIGPDIERQESFSAEPGAPSDSRVFRVRIQPTEQGVLARRINGKVDVVIEP